MSVLYMPCYVCLINCKYIFYLNLTLNLFSFQQADFDMLLVNLRMDPINVKENMRIQWVSEAGMVESITSIIKEYKQSRGLLVSRFTLLNIFKAALFW